MQLFLLAITTLRMLFYNALWPITPQRPHPATLTDDEFWRLTENCLIVFHRIQEEDAYELCKRTAERINVLPGRQRILVYTMVYQTTPFNFACDLADNQLNFMYHAYAYNRILNGEVFLPYN